MKFNDHLYVKSPISEDDLYSYCFGSMESAFWCSLYRVNFFKIGKRSYLPQWVDEGCYGLNFTCNVSEAFPIVRAQMLAMIAYSIRKQQTAGRPRVIYGSYAIFSSSDRVVFNALDGSTEIIITSEIERVDVERAFQGCGRLSIVQSPAEDLVEPSV